MQDPKHAHANMSDPHTTIHPPAGAHHVHEAPPLHDPPDDWHDHSHDEKPQHAHGEVQNSNLIMGVGIALTLFITVSVLVVYGFYVHYNTQRSDDRERVNSKFANGPAQVTRDEKNKDLLAIRDGDSFQIPTEAEGVNKTVTLSPFKTAAESVARSYTTPSSAPATKK